MAKQVRVCSDMCIPSATHLRIPGLGPTSLASVTLPHTCISMIERERLKIIKPIQIFTPVTDEATNYLMEAEQAL